MSQYGLAGYMTSIKEWSANLAFHVQVALSIAMGLGIDYGVYMVSRLREEMKNNQLDWQKSLQQTLSSTGSAIVISVIVLLGSMIPLMNTSLAPKEWFFPQWSHIKETEPTIAIILTSIFHTFRLLLDKSSNNQS